MVRYLQIRGDAISSWNDSRIVSIIKRLFGGHLMSISIRTQNGELSFRSITYDIQVYID